jgi:hypothetical protein
MKQSGSTGKYKVCAVQAGLLSKKTLRKLVLYAVRLCLTHRFWFSSPWSTINEQRWVLYREVFPAFVAKLP